MASPSGETQNPSSAEASSSEIASTTRDARQSRIESRRWWIKLFVQPILFLACAATAIAGLGLAQRLGWVSDGAGHSNLVTVAAAAVDYICPMMCTPPQQEPGRCPVCAMELVLATAGSGGGDSRSIEVDPASRRVANIRTVPVKCVPMERTIRAIGELAYDEGSLRTIAAWSDGRLDRLYADYTGVVVNKGDHLALVYSPELYSGQVELLLAKKAQRQPAGSTSQRVLLSGGGLYSSARERLIELGMTEEQVAQVEQRGEANSRLHLCAPISGTVIEKLAVEGEYVKEGQPIYKLADLSTLWLMLELFPKDAAAVRYGQRVTATVQSLPGRTFTGRVAFIDPEVDLDTRTVGVRVVIPNQKGLLRVGDYAKAEIRVPVIGIDSLDSPLFDPELAGKWISPRHPHIVSDAPGHCPLCGIDLLPASEFGFAREQAGHRDVLVVPRNAVLMAGEHSVVYVETEPGRFEIRRVTLGSAVDGEIVILQGLAANEQVATSGNFLIDSQMQLAGNPSLIDPTRAKPPSERTDVLSAEMLAEIEKLPPTDQEMAKAQGLCPVADMKLGSMGQPVKVRVKNTDVFICCEGCRERLLAEPDEYLAKLAEQKERNGSDLDSLRIELPSMGEIERVPMPLDFGTDGETTPLVTDALDELTAADRELALRQQVCPVADMQLGSMGTPIKVDVQGRPVFICCEGCRERLLAEPEKYLAKLPKEAIR